MKTWEQIIEQPVPSWEALNEQFKTEKEMFTFLGKLAKKEMQKKHYQLMGRNKTYSDISPKLKVLLLKDHAEWQQKWGNESIEAKKIEEQHDQRFDDSLVRLKKYDDLITQQPLNRIDITASKADKFEAMVQEQILEVTGQQNTLEREEFMKQFVKPKTNERNFGLER